MLPGRFNHDTDAGRCFPVPDDPGAIASEYVDQIRCIQIVRQTASVASGEIAAQENLDTVAATFQSLFYGYAFHAAVGKAFDPAGLEAQMMGFYYTLSK